MNESRFHLHLWGFSDTNEEEADGGGGGGEGRTVSVNDELDGVPASSGTSARLISEHLYPPAWLQDIVLHM